MSPEEQASDRTSREAFFDTVQKFRAAVEEVIVSIKASPAAYSHPHGQYVNLAVVQLMSASHWATLLQGVVGREAITPTVTAVPVTMDAPGLSDIHSRINAIFQSFTLTMKAPFAQADELIAIRIDKTMDQLWRAMTEAKMWIGHAIEPHSVSTQPSPVSQGVSL